MGVGGVGSVAAEMLTRCGVGRLMLYGEEGGQGTACRGWPGDQSAYVLCVWKWLLRRVGLVGE